MRSGQHFWLWTAFFFAASLGLGLVAFRIVAAPPSSLAAAKILLFGAVLLGLMSLSNALHERRLH
jgi:hypothetical protein